MFKEKLDPTKDVKFSARLLKTVGKPIVEKAKPHFKSVANDAIEPYLRKIFRE